MKMGETTEQPQVAGPRQYRNSERLVAQADPVWQAAAEQGLIGFRVNSPPGGRLSVLGTTHEFINMCSCSYLGLNYHPDLIDGAVDAIRSAGLTALSVAPTRIKHSLLGQLEDELSELFGAPILVGISCSVLTSGILPLLASGHLAEGGPRVMVFDRFAHFSMAYIKPLCADETLVLTCPNNDLDYLEDICRRYPRVAYVADGVYSMGGATVLKGLLDLQDRYGMYLYLDDSHSLSIVGTCGEGYVRSQLEMNPLTTIVASLGKGFGTRGGIAMLGRPELRGFLERHAGPVGWSQELNVAMIGASLASARIHRSPELGELRGALQRNIDYFDGLMPTPLAGNGLPVRRIQVGDAAEAVRLSAELFRRGYYSSAVFFPIVPKGAAGLRIMLRADLRESDIAEFVGMIEDICVGVPATAGD